MFTPANKFVWRYGVSDVGRAEGRGSRGNATMSPIWDEEGRGGAGGGTTVQVYQAWGTRTGVTL
jgi:hypothetical protein